MVDLSRIPQALLYLTIFWFACFSNVSLQVTALSSNEGRGRYQFLKNKTSKQTKKKKPRWFESRDKLENQCLPVIFILYNTVWAPKGKAFLRRSESEGTVWSHGNLAWITPASSFVSGAVAMLLSLTLSAANQGQSSNSAVLRVQSMTQSRLGFANSYPSLTSDRDLHCHLQISYLLFLVFVVQDESHKSFNNKRIGGTYL